MVVAEQRGSTTSRSKRLRKVAIRKVPNEPPQPQRGKKRKQESASKLMNSEDKGTRRSLKTGGKGRKKAVSTNDRWLRNLVHPVLSQAGRGTQPKPGQNMEKNALGYSPKNQRRASRPAQALLTKWKEMVTSKKRPGGGGGGGERPAVDS